MKKIEKIPNPKDFTLAPPQDSQQVHTTNMIIFSLGIQIQNMKMVFNI